MKNKKNLTWQSNHSLKVGKNHFEKNIDRGTNMTRLNYERY